MVGLKGSPGPATRLPRIAPGPVARNASGPHLQIHTIAVFSTARYVQDLMVHAGYEARADRSRSLQESDWESAWVSARHCALGKLIEGVEKATGNDQPRSFH